MARTAIYYSEKALAHDTGEFHPESSDRLRAALDAIRRSGLNTPIVEPEAASIEDICRIHTREHVDTVQRCCLGKETYPDPDTVFMEHTWDAALLAAGAGITAARAILDGACENAFVLMRPPWASCRARLRDGVLRVQQHRHHGKMDPRCSQSAPGGYF
ncbi:MAG: hypothetical protein KBH78_09040 [Candidatus Hydrogenedentes bacterium]|nr:hypothetical protein [Candidatus Hydrogenedentota bacterium]